MGDPCAFCLMAGRDVAHQSPKDHVHHLPVWYPKGGENGPNTWTISLLTSGRLSGDGR